MRTLGGWPATSSPRPTTPSPTSTSRGWLLLLLPSDQGLSPAHASQRGPWAGGQSDPPACQPPPSPATALGGRASASPRRPTTTLASKDLGRPSGVLLVPADASLPPPCPHRSPSRQQVPRGAGWLPPSPGRPSPCRQTTSCGGGRGAPPAPPPPPLRTRKPTAQRDGPMRRATGGGAVNRQKDTPPPSSPATRMAKKRQGQPPESTTGGAVTTDARGGQGHPQRHPTAPGRGPPRPRDASSSPSPLSPLFSPRH